MPGSSSTARSTASRTSRRAWTRRSRSGLRRRSPASRPGRMLPSADLIRDALGYGVLVPAAATLAVWALWWWGGRRRAAPALPPSQEGAGAEAVVGALSVGAGLVAGWAALAWSGQLDWGFLKPVDPWQWVLVLSLLALAAGAVERGFGLPAAPRWALRLAVAGLTAWLLVVTPSAVQRQHPAWYAAVG